MLRRFWIEIVCRRGDVELIGLVIVRLGDIVVEFDVAKE